MKIPDGPLDHDMIEQLRLEQLEETRAAFAMVLSSIQLFRNLSRTNPGDIELKILTDNLHDAVKHLLNTVTCKVIANGLAADWEKLFESGGEDARQEKGT